ncbi:hypothetical protein AR457_37140 [Streptomyces agglomeratus]|nr:hypothetical protein AR457_37140 [Streptomyces agglomeratus]
MEGAPLPGAYWLHVPPRTDDTCTWCAQLSQGSAQGAKAGPAEESGGSTSESEPAARMPRVDAWMAEIVRMVMLSRPRAQLFQRRSSSPDQSERQ